MTVIQAIDSATLFAIFITIITVAVRTEHRITIVETILKHIKENCPSCQRHSDKNLD